MKRKTSLRINFIYKMTYEVLILALPFLTSPYISRVLGAEGLGVYSYSYSVAYYFALFSMLGLKNYGSRIIARVSDNRKQLDDTFSNVVTLHILISLFCTIIYLIYILSLTNTDKLCAQIQIFFVLGSLFDISWFYFGIEHFKLTVIRSTIIRIITLICIFIFVKNKNDLLLYCFIMSFSYLISQLTLWIPLKKYVTFVAPSWKKMKQHIKPMLILFIPAIAISVYKYMDKIMIGMLSSKTQLGYYENAEKAINIPMTIIGSYGTIMLPKISNLVASHNIKDCMKYVTASMEYVMCLAFALAFGLASVAINFAQIFWGKEFELSGYLIMGLAITIPFVSFANVIRTQYLIPNEKDKEYMSSIISGSIVNLILNNLLINRLGAIGAVIGTIGAEITVCVLQSIIVRKQLPIISFLKKSSPFLLIGLIMFTIVFRIGCFLENNLTSLIIQILIGILIYFVLCLIYFLKTKNKIVIYIYENLKHKNKHS